jgi:hypothetical protein
MIGWILYTLGTFLVGLVLAFVISFFSGGPTKSPEKPYRIIAVCLVLCMGGPFAYTEGLTLLYGKPMLHAVRVVYNDAPVFGKIQYYRVTHVTADKASVYIVGLEHYGGMDDRPIIQAELVKKNGAWKADSYHIVSSMRWSKDNITFPPYN